MMSNWKTGLGFATALGSLTTLMIPALSVVLALLGLFFFFWGRGEGPKGMRIAIPGMAALALILDLLYLLVS